MFNKLPLSSKALILNFIFLYFCTSCSSDYGVEWHMVDVNFYKGLQGDAHLILDDDHVALIDAGYGGVIGDSLTNYIKDLGIKRIHKFIISHPHRDHYEGIRNILAAGIKVDSVYYNANISMNDCCFKKDDFFEVLSTLTKQGAELNDVSEGQVLSLGRTSFKVLFAAKSTSLDGKGIDMNDASIIMRWEVFDHSVLFAGDLNAVSGKYLTNYKPLDIQVDVLKVPHHGATGIAPIEFFETVAPKVLMFPDPDWVRTSTRGEIAFGYANSSGIESCSNSENGTVKLIFKDHFIYAEPSRPSDSCTAGIIISKSS